MLIPFQYILSKYQLKITGILHIGAHECEEINEYEKIIPRERILWVEALEDKVNYCRSHFPNIFIEQAVVSDTVSDVIFHRSNNGQSSSFLDLGLHKTFHPHVWYVNDYSVKTTVTKTILDKYLDTVTPHINFINLDIQGAELKALKGLDENFFKQIYYIYTEVNSDYVYKDCAIIGEIDDYLAKFGFVRVETSWCEDYRWGDAFYIKVSHNITPTGKKNKTKNYKK
jgi:FkbM family methyltransferase